MERDRERRIKRDREKRLSCPGRIRESIFARRAVNDLIRLIVCSALLLPRARARFMQRWRSDIRTNDNALFPAIAPRAGSYGVTTRSRDKWITTDYAHRTEINSAAIASRRADEKNWNGMDDLEHKGAVERTGGKLEKSTSPTYPVRRHRRLRPGSKWGMGGREVSLMGWLMRGSEDNVVIISSCGDDGGGVAG